MTKRAIVIWLAFVVFGVAAMGGQQTVVPPLPAAEEIATAPSFGPDQHVVAAHYFYWYKWPSEHFFDDPPACTDDGLRHHFRDHEQVSDESVAWHRRQMEDFKAAGIDVALCIYWGAPNQYDKPAIRFSVAGLPPLIEALDAMSKDGPAPKVGLFYDTSTLLAEHAFTDGRKENVDLRTDEGKDIFYRTIRDFFRFVPPRHWACIDGHPLVQLYGASFAAGNDQSTIDYVYEHFPRDFAGRKPFVVSGPSWSFKSDTRTGWGAAINGPILREGISQVGPGYDDSPVPGRLTPTRDRLGGGYYSASWLLALQRKPRIVIIETWDELHEGTGICESIEDGRLYIDLTRRYSDMLKAGKLPTGDDWAFAVRRLLDSPSSNHAGREFASRLEPSFEVRNGGTLDEQGVSICRDEADGPFDITEIDGTPCVRSHQSIGTGRHLYFAVADPYYYDHSADVTLKFTYLDEGTTPIVIHYDSARETGSLEDRYLTLEREIKRQNTREWKTVTVTLPQARFANRQNGGADFRFASEGDEVTIRDVSVSKLPAGYGR
ncbi:MAG: DUF5010 domain-containing protein [Phycisphaerae bacterium]|nr:DUF5010 domain-containing protein [Phycisphaerae bacterium]